MDQRFESRRAQSYHQGILFNIRHACKTETLKRQNTQKFNMGDFVSSKVHKGTLQKI